MSCQRDLECVSEPSRVGIEIPGHRVELLLVLLEGRRKLEPCLAELKRNCRNWLFEAVCESDGKCNVNDV